MLFAHKYLLPISLALMNMRKPTPKHLQTLNGTSMSEIKALVPPDYLIEIEAASILAT